MENTIKEKPAKTIFKTVPLRYTPKSFFVHHFSLFHYYFNQLVEFLWQVDFDLMSLEQTQQINSKL